MDDEGEKEKLERRIRVLWAILKNLKKITEKKRGELKKMKRHTKRHGNKEK